MKQLLFAILILLSFNCFAQNSNEDFAPFLANTAKKAILRKEPDSTSQAKISLPIGSQLYAFSENESNGYIKVIDIKTNKIGWVKSSTIRKVRDLPLSQSNAFQESGSSSGDSPEVVIKNTSGLTISLIVGGKYIALNPRSTITETVDSGEQYYTASAPMVIPLSGKHDFKSSSKYEWTFSIITKRR